MARPLVRWLVGILLVIGLVGLVYLPPRGVPAWARGRVQRTRDNDSRDRARQLALEWREVNATIEGIRYREAIGTALAARREKGRFGPILLAEDIADSLLGRSAGQVQEGLDSAWTLLGLSETKISVGVIARDPLSSSGRRLIRFTEGGYGLSFAVPDTASHTSCLVLARYPTWLARRKYIPGRELLLWAGTVLGPCAYYARFGVPSPRVERWLGHRQFDLALVPSWRQAASLPVDDPESDDTPFLSTLIWQSWIYSFPRQVAACFAGRPEACRRAVAAGDGGTEGPRPRAIVPPDRWDVGKSLLAGADHYLAAVLQQAGAERFQEFWTTTLPVDSALSLALGEPVGRFTARYQREVGPAPRFGAATTPLDAALGLASAALVVGLTMLAQRRREVR